MNKDQQSQPGGRDVECNRLFDLSFPIIAVEMANKVLRKLFRYEFPQRWSIVDHVGKLGNNTLRFVYPRLKLFNPFLCLVLGGILSLGLCHADQIPNGVDEKSTDRERTANPIEFPQRTSIKESANGNDATAPSGAEFPIPKSVDLHLLMKCFFGACIIIMLLYQVGDLVTTRLVRGNSLSNAEGEPPA